MDLFSLVGIGKFFRFGNKPEFCALLIDPLFVGLSAANLPFDLIVEENLSFFQVCPKHASRANSSFLGDCSFPDGKGSCLGGEDEALVFCDEIAKRAKSISIECGTNRFAVGK